MTALLIISTVWVIAIGYVIMRRIDGFFTNVGFADSRAERMRNGVVVFGSHDAACGARRAGVRCTEITEPVLSEDIGDFAAVLILSEDEKLNLELCRAARKIDSGIGIVVRCGEPSLKKTCEKLGDCCVVPLDMSVDNVLSELWGVLK